MKKHFIEKSSNFSLSKSHQTSALIFSKHEEYSKEKIARKEPQTSIATIKLLFLKSFKMQFKSAIALKSALGEGNFNCILN